MKIILSFLGIVLFNHFLYAQSVSQELLPIWGEERRNFGKNSPHLYLIKEKDAYYSISESGNYRSKKHKSSSLLVKFDQELNIIKELNLQEICSFEFIYFKHILSFREKLYMIFESINSDSNEAGIFAQELNPEELTLIGYPVKITDISVDGIISKAVPSSPNQDAFTFQFSPDKTKLLIIHQLIDSQGVNQGYNFLLVNENFENLGGFDFPITMLQHEQGIYLPQVENSGNFHFLAGPQQIGEKGKSTGIKAPYLLTSYTLKTNTTAITSLDLEGEMLSKIGLAVDPSGTILIGGFYTADQVVENTSGLFFLNINSTDHRVISRKTIPFNQINTAASNLQVNGESNKISDLLGGNPPLHVKDLLITEDGNLMLVGETFEQKTSMLNANRPMSNRTQAVFGNILAVGLSPHGHIRWNHVVSKNQLVGEKDFDLASFSMWQAENNLYLLFNDNKKNTDPLSLSKIHPFHTLMKKKDHSLSLVSIASSGNPQKSQIDLYTKIGKSAKKLLSVSLKENKMIVLDKKKNSIRIVRLEPRPTPPIQLENATLASDTLKRQR
ncbi:hypothetical protein [Lunatibacter salilacus]|uniref:hypothetical protein n=1 Tax=Lunatibacter salilacus TaxID=2483804 RepID=UPI00131C8357|nr:hypothetical protein [Lunatibacter salilacus]